MINTMPYISAIILLVITLFSLSFFISSIYEKEIRASIFAGLQTFILIAILYGFLYLNSSNYLYRIPGLYILFTVYFLLIFFTVLFLIPIGRNPKAKKGTGGLVYGYIKKVDERDTIFSKVTRQKLESDDPDKLSIMPEMGRIDGERGKSNVVMGEMASDFARSIAKQEYLEPPVSENRIELSPQEASERVKNYAKSLGAVLTGITELNPDWIYTHYGRSGIATDQWAEEITLKYKYAIVFATEMDVDMINAAPHTPVILESLKNYAEGAFIATLVASFIAGLGYPAKVNQMAHYDTLIVPLAVDAGLGELSRMGYLITREYGPRVRLSAVLTDLPMIPDKPVDIGVVDFCSKCKKCAINCPSNSIAYEKRLVENGTHRWIMDRESCFNYWQKVGTDCCICMRVCPWSHARTFPHRVISWMVARNSIARSLFTYMDDIYYGKKPPLGRKSNSAKFN